MSKNFGDQIKDAIQDAISTQDFSSMKTAVEQSLNAATASIKSGLEAAQRNAKQRNEAERAEYIRRQNEHFARINAQRQAIMTMQNRYLSASGMKTGGYLMALFAIPIGLLFGAATIVGITDAAFDAASLAAAVICGIVTLGSVLGCVFGFRRARFASRFEAYRRVIGSRTYCSVQELATNTGVPREQVLKDLHKMIGKGMFRQGHLDAASTTLMVTDEAYQQYRDSMRAKAERDRQEQLVGAVDADAPLSPEAQAMIERGEAFIAKIHASNDDIPGEVVSAKIAQIELVLQTIFDRAEEHPEVIGDLEQLMDYYLPVTIKLLDAYADLDKQPIQSESILASKKEIEETLDTLNTAFEKLLDSIFQDTAWDVSTDISVLHTVLAQEGLVDNPFDRNQKEN